MRQAMRSASSFVIFHNHVSIPFMTTLTMKAISRAVTHPQGVTLLVQVRLQRGHLVLRHHAAGVCAGAGAAAELQPGPDPDEDAE
jgi:hypothetical protein